MAVSFGIHGLLLVLFIFLLAWRAPDPPLPEYGIELNFGLDNVGTGDVQKEIPANDNDSEEEAKPDEPTEQPEVEEVMEQSVEEVTETIEEVVEEVVPEPEAVVTQPIESPDVVKEEEKPAPEKEPVKEPEEVKESTPEPLKYPDKNPTDGGGGKDGDSNSPESSNHGDNTDATGDKGDPEGTIDSRALYGTSGGGGGSSLSMTGWVWDAKPRPNDQSDENGRIVFEIKIDEDGEIIYVKTIEKTVSPAVERVYRQEVEKLTFSPTSGNTVPAPTSTGRITFIIKSK